MNAPPIAPRLPGYRELAPLGRGGFSEVFRAYQEQFDRWVAVKVLTFPLDDDAAQRRFLRECRLAGRLSTHPNIVTVYDAGISPDGRPYLAMELFEQGSLSTAIATRGVLDAAESVRTGIALAGALETAHRAGVVHRDVKPGNVLMSSYGQPVLTDFGLSVVVERLDTLSGTDALTPFHTAPEVLEGTTAGPAADVYALASTLYAVLMGRAPHEEPSDPSLGPLLRRITEQDPPRLTRPDLPPALIELIAAALARDPAGRPRTALVLAHALQDVQRSLGGETTEPVVLEVPPPAPDVAAVLADPSPSPSPGAPTVTASPPPPPPPPPAPATDRDEAVDPEPPAEPPPPPPPPPPLDADETLPKAKITAAATAPPPSSPSSPAPPKTAPPKAEPPRPPVTPAPKSAPAPPPPPIEAPEAPAAFGTSPFAPSSPDRSEPSDLGDVTIERERLRRATMPAPLPPPAPRPGNRRGVLLVAALVLLVVAIVGAGALLLSSGGDDDPSSPQDDGDGDESSEPLQIEVPQGLTAAESDAGVQLDWEGGEATAYVVLILSEDDQPYPEQVTGPSLLVEATRLEPNVGYCFTVASQEGLTIASDANDTEAAFSAPVCIRGAAEDTVLQGGD